MPGIARIGDIVIGTCPCHDSPRSYVGVIATGAPTVLVEGRPAATIGSVAVGCHPAIVCTGNATVLSGGRPTATIGGIAVGCPTGVIVTGAGTVIA